ncbi:MAG: site-specific integrase [Firmicutes bacterium]|nr:site-specific integrase [Bacillota bacterium]
MNTVEPIRSKDQIAAIKKILAATNLRDAAWFTLGINTGLRIGDLLALQIRDVHRTKTQWQDRIIVIERKTGKRKDFPLSSSAKQILGIYLATRPDADLSDPLFPSRSGGGPLKRGQAWAILHRAARLVGVTDAIGTHTLRKTFGYWAYHSGVDLAVIQDLLNHSSPSTTLTYIGIRREDRDAVYLGLNL